MNILLAVGIIRASWRYDQAQDQAQAQTYDRKYDWGAAQADSDLDKNEQCFICFKLAYLQGVFWVWFDKRQSSQAGLMMGLMTGFVDCLELPHVLYLPAAFAHAAS